MHSRDELAAELRRALNAGRKERSLPKILYVEDNEDNVYMLRRRLAKHGYEMIVAEDGAKGVEAAMREKPDLILMDLGLPVLSGWEAAQQLKGFAKDSGHPYYCPFRACP